MAVSLAASVVCRADGPISTMFRASACVSNIGNSSTLLVTDSNRPDSEPPSLVLVDADESERADQLPLVTFGGSHDDECAAGRENAVQLGRIAWGEHTRDCVQHTRPHRQPVPDIGDDRTDPWMRAGDPSGRSLGHVDADPASTGVLEDSGEIVTGSGADLENAPALPHCRNHRVDNRIEMVPVEETNPRGQHLSRIPGDLSRAARQQADVTLPRHVEGMAPVAQHGAVLGVQIGAAVRASQQIHHIGEHRLTTSRLSTSQSPACRFGKRGSASNNKQLTGDALQLFTEGSRLVRGEFDDEAPTAFERYSHDDPSSFFGCFEGTVTGPGLHRRHPLLPPDLRHQLERVGKI